MNSRKTRNATIVLFAISVAFFTYTFINMTFEGLMEDLTSFDFYLDVAQSAGMGAFLSWVAFRQFRFTKRESKV